MPEQRPTVPAFPTELRTRLVVQYLMIEGNDSEWTDPRRATVGHLIAALRELPEEERRAIAALITPVKRFDPRCDQELVERVRQLWPDHRAELAGAIGMLPEDVAERLRFAEEVLDALGDAQLSIDRLRAYRAKYPVRQPDPAEISASEAASILHDAIADPPPAEFALAPEQSPERKATKIMPLCGVAVMRSLPDLSSPKPKESDIDADEDIPF